MRDILGISANMMFWYLFKSTSVSDDDVSDADEGGSVIYTSYTG